jgi:hypothetical protein
VHEENSVVSNPPLTQQATRPQQELVDFAGGSFAFTTPQRVPTSEACLDQVMNKSETIDSTIHSARCLALLSRLLLGSDKSQGTTRAIQEVASYDREQLGQLWGLATSHHVLMRTFPALHRVVAREGNSRSEWLENAVKTERARIDHALRFLAPICEALEDVGEVVVIKSLDHWPDLGSDLDLYTTAAGAEVVSVMRERFHARLAGRSWGDRLANKWNFIIPGLPELVEVHVGRLGQTGEQVAITDSLVAQAKRAEFGPHTFRVPGSEDRVIISTLQRMYRHFYLRLCDIADNARLADAEAIDFLHLECVARSAGIWEGVATYLAILAEYVEQYRDRAFKLPPFIMDDARFFGTEVRLRKRFLRIPIFPQGASLYVKEWAKLLFNGELQNTLRLSLLPGLAAAAAVAAKISGSDKGIW